MDREQLRAKRMHWRDKSDKQSDPAGGEGGDLDSRPPRSISPTHHAHPEQNGSHQQRRQYRGLKTPRMQRTRSRGVVGKRVRGEQHRSGNWPELDKLCHQSHGLRMSRGIVLAKITTAKKMHDAVPSRPRKWERSSAEPPSSLPSRALRYWSHAMNPPAMVAARQTRLIACRT